MFLVKTSFVLCIVAYIVIPVTAPPPGDCPQECPVFDSSLCKNGYHIPPGQCCEQCKGENVCPANLLCKTIACEKDDDCDPGKKCCDCVGGGTVCSKDNADSDETNSEDTDSDSS